MKQKIDRLISTVFDYYNINPLNATEQKNNKRSIVQAKYICFLLIKEFEPKMTLDNIGNRFRGQKHDAVLYGLRTIKDIIEVDKIISNDYNKLRANVEYIYESCDIEHIKFLQISRQKKSLYYRQGLNR